MPDTHLREHESVIRQLLADFQKQQDYARGVSGEPTPNLDNIIVSLKYFLTLLPQATEEVKEWPKPRNDQLGELDSIHGMGFDEAREQCLKVHQSVVAEKDREIARLKEFEWKYKELCK